MASTIELLNELLALHSNSLPSYLVNAKPWSARRDAKVLEALAAVADDHRRMTDLIGSHILELGGSIQGGEFPMLYTDMHDLSSDYILNEVCRFQKLENSRIEQIADELAGSPKAQALAKEALGAGKAHLQNLGELLAESAV
ncbi:MAG: hypothetical protein KDB27_12555 [Planctomycetales bacterium]|nr:hypothetical protein [Planctomycetales bacterium]